MQQVYVYLQPFSCYISRQ